MLILENSDLPYVMKSTFLDKGSESSDGSCTPSEEAEIESPRAVLPSFVRKCRGIWPAGQGMLEDGETSEEMLRSVKPRLVGGEGFFGSAIVQ